MVTSAFVGFLFLYVIICGLVGIIINPMPVVRLFDGGQQ